MDGGRAAFGRQALADLSVGARRAPMALTTPRSPRAGSACRSAPLLLARQRRPLAVVGEVDAEPLEKVEEGAA
jgi:hypothetical protein